jgi:hypothetical protein
LFGSNTDSVNGLIIRLNNYRNIEITSCNGDGDFNTVITFDGYIIDSDNWYYIVVIHSHSNNKTTLFVNGENQGTKTDNNTYLAINTIGGYFLDIDHSTVFSGNIACIRISNTSSIYNKSSDVISVPTQPTSYNESTTIFLMQTYLQNSFAVLPYGIQIQQNNITFDISTPF